MTTLHIILLCSLILFPMAVFWCVRTRMPRHLFAATGAAFGLVVTPWAFGLYSLIALGPVWALLGFPGLAMAWFHEPPGFHAAVVLGLAPRGEIVTGGALRVAIELINGVVWSLFYGVLGAAIDSVRRRNV